MNAISRGCSAVRRSDQVLAALGAATRPIPGGSAHYSAARPDLPECNFIGDAAIDDLDSFEAVNAAFGECAARCRMWVPALGLEVAPLAGRLLPRGFRQIEFTAWLWNPGRPPLAKPADGMRVLAGRAMPRAFQAVVAERAAGGALAPQRASLAADRLDSPHYEPFVALVDERPAGTAALLQAGEIGRICELFVISDLRGRGVGRALVDALLRTAMRWSLRPICARSPAPDAAAARFLEKTGFVPDGTMTAFLAADSEEPAE